MKKQKPIFNVLFHKNNGEIGFVNWFDFGQWNVIKKELLKIKRKFSKLKTGSEVEKEKMLSRNFFSLHNTFDSVNDDIVEFVVNEKLISECIYYFWSKCEYEIIVKQWVGKESETKIDVYDQLNANWDSFKKIVFEQIGM